MKLTFLGTGGGRFDMIEQVRQTGGFVLEKDDAMVAVDPAPGALVYGKKNGIDFRELDAIFVSHLHLDHQGDAEVLIEAMTDGCKEKRGKLITTEQVLEGPGDDVPYISNYHKECVDELLTPSRDEKVDVNGLEIEITETYHEEGTETIGFKVGTKDGKIGYIADTEYDKRIIDQYEDCKYLVINVLRPYTNSWEGHLNLKDGARLVEEIEPEKAIFQHFGLRFAYKFRDQIEWLEENAEDLPITLTSDNKAYKLGEEESAGLGKFTD
ncbi:MAG: MBL fold metallo-hydrolase [Candidatus Nanohaloarchaeota archaeon QJJ-9]|nr:MBL fold metallo-hydrolase [Candidatus Nanohaloarchaeota archaeon QJJ-9]